MMKSRDEVKIDSRRLVDELGDAVVWGRVPADLAGDDGATGLVDDVQDALATPIDFPSITQAVIPGDQVVIAVDAVIPNLPALIVEISQQFVDSQLANLDVLLSEDASDDLMMDLASALGKSATVGRHDSSRRESLMYLMADANGEPVYLNRKIVDADFVLPVQAQHAGGRLHLLSLVGAAGLFPCFADSASQARLRKVIDDDDDQLNEFQRDLGMTLGVQVMLQVQVNAEGTCRGFRCGAPSVLAPPAFEASDQPSADVVVCCIDGDGHQQSWTNLARAATAVATHADESTTIVLWSAIKEPPSDRLRLAIQRGRAAGEGLEAGEHTEEDLSGVDPSDLLNGDGFPDSDVMDDVGAVLSGLRDRCRIVLRSEVDDETVEELGFGVLHSAEQLKKLVTAGSSCGLIRAAQFCGNRILR